MLAFAVVALSACGGDSTSSGVTVPPVPVAPKISALTLSSDSVVIDGSSTPFTATIGDVAPDIQGAMIQGHITQGTTRRATGSMQINCSGSAAQPKGPCVVSYAIEASNSGDGSGILVEGAATFKVQLTQNGTALDTKTAAVKLASKPPADQRCESVRTRRRSMAPQSRSRRRSRMSGRASRAWLSRAMPPKARRAVPLVRCRSTAEAV